MAIKRSRWLVRTSKLLWWFAGVATADMVKLPERTRQQYAALGLLLMLNWVLLTVVWMKVGFRYFSWAGLFVPGLVVPGMLVLGLDRLIAMRARKLTPLGLPNPPGMEEDRGREKVYRFLFALVFATLTSFTFMLDLSESDIHAAQQSAASQANEPLRKEYRERIDATASAAASTLLASVKPLEERLSTLSQERKVQQEVAMSSAKAAREARTQASIEDGGLDGRPAGRKQRFHAYDGLAKHTQEAADQASARVQALDLEIDGVHEAVAKQHADLAQIETQRIADQAGVEQSIRADPRYYTPASGMFADATTFLMLYSHPEQGLGRSAFTATLFPVLVIFECCALLGLAINPTSPLDVLVAAGNRGEAARIVGEHAVSAARHRQPQGPVHVRPLGPQAQHAGPQAEPREAV